MVLAVAGPAFGCQLLADEANGLQRQADVRRRSEEIGRIEDRRRAFDAHTDELVATRNARSRQLATLGARHRQVVCAASVDELQAERVRRVRALREERAAHYLCLASSAHRLGHDGAIACLLGLAAGRPEAAAACDASEVLSSPDARACGQAPQWVDAEAQIAELTLSERGLAAVPSCGTEARR